MQDIILFPLAGFQRDKAVLCCNVLPCSSSNPTEMIPYGSIVLIHSSDLPFDGVLKERQGPLTSPGAI